MAALPTPKLSMVPNTDDGSRLSAFTRLVSSLWNSLVDQRILLQVTTDTWRIRSAGSFVEPADPGVSDDVGIGAFQGAVWVNTVSQQAWVCIDNAAGAALWKQIS